MPIHYVLVKNKLAGKPNRYMAHVRSIRTMTIEDVVDHIVDRGSTVGKADVLAVLEDCESVIVDMVLQGMRVRTPLACYGASVRGNFYGSEDQFSPARHKVYPIVNPGSRIKRAFKHRARLTKKPLKRPLPVPETYIDVLSEARNSILTPEGVGRLSGHRLKFDPDDPKQGIFFVASDKSATRVDLVIGNSPSLQIFQVPDLSPGEYHLEVRATVHGEWVKTGRLSQVLTVVPAQ